MPNEAVQNLRPRTDISARTLLARFEDKLDGFEARTSARFSQMDAAHLHLAGRLEDVAATVVETQVAVARIEGERATEHRLAETGGTASKYRPIQIAAAILGAVVAIPAALATGWGVVASVYHAIVHAAPHP
jgi:hypothetical protein